MPDESRGWSKEPPVEPGAYWWRAKEGDEAFVRNLIRWSCGDLLIDRYLGLGRVADIGGEWLPVPSPERLMELLRTERMWKEHRCRTELEKLLDPDEELLSRHPYDVSGNPEV